ncbi:tRNA (adenosine(37)-N6)-threonylcarbamoyltransferase complex dimerization subunit type 1 TsaB [Pseudidiomarina halophila]|uniref:tRNA threonylcarbamoyladenosine biosynthesis protein TsaB n=1 Tax=Pseudidiomarina halophila TaxID=1449799 RepID=A0A432XZV3_9GAMM|nr:tRNA (adenosine(37)-N6)-threonylcarbamoyltransferase complex dimerization subunit type 1 TsaB [Pseudidiomarina halophila]RUO54213.1 tRNA (adenosine(37)-N6)-threonylcarbamoyltransferase complex dimerization subunit type 1 TsaB [Pseudidiomarina halophila]
MTAVLLAIDTATEQCSVALRYQDQVFQRAAVTPREHSQRVLGFVEEVLAEAGITLAAVDGIVCGYGPGSFTGVRIGVAISQGLAFSHTLPVYPVSTLAALAQQAIRCHAADTIVSAIDARMQEVYVASFNNQDGVAQPLMEPQMAALSDLTEQPWWPATETVVGAGTGWQAYGPQLDPQQQVRVLADVTLPLAADMLILADHVEPVAAEKLEPLYVRNEVTWKKLPGR